jgi:ribosomal-protein-alanine N-acetyltransferase
MLDLSAAFAAFPVLKTERLLLREIAPDDAAALFQLMADPQVTRYYGVAPAASPEEAAERIARIRQRFVEQEGVRWAITSRESGELIGSCGFWRLVKPHFRAEIGYELAPAWWGRGLIPEAVAAALTFGFARMGLHSVEATIHPANAGSRRVLEKLCFAQEGYFRESYYDSREGRFTDAAVFSLLRPAWLARPDAR